MLTSRGRLLCGLFSLAIAGALFAARQPIGWVFVGHATLMVYGYVRYGPMVLAFQAYHTADWQRLEKLLLEVRRPAWLSAQNRAYHDFLSGVLAQFRGDLQAARQHLLAADGSRLRTDHIRCVLECHRADAALATGDRVAAGAHLSAARSTPHRPEVEPELLRLESLMAKG